MSYCEIIAFKDGKYDFAKDYSNAWGGAARIWNSMYDRYAAPPDKEYTSWLTDEKRLWALAKRLDIPNSLRAVFMATFDHAYVLNRYFKQYIADLNEFQKTFPCGNRVCHLAKWVKFIEENNTVEAIGFHATSVGENQWLEWNEEKGEYDPIKIDPEKHCDVYAELNHLNVYWAAHPEEYEKEILPLYHKIRIGNNLNVKTKT